MRIKIEKGAPKTLAHLAWGPIAILAIVFVGLMKNFLPLIPACAFRRITGLPCLTCGGTRCVAELSGFHLISSLQYNPLIMIVILGLILFSMGVLGSFLLKRKPAILLSRVEVKTARYTAISLIALNWIFLLLRYKTP